MMSNQTLNSLWAQIPQCRRRRCPLHQLDPRQVAVPGEGPYNSPLLFIGRNPGRVEVRRQQPFVGRAGFRFDQMLTMAGIDRAKCLIDNLVKCFTTDNAPPPKLAIQCCTDRWLRREFAEFSRLKLVVTLGRMAESWYVKNPLLPKVGHLAMVHPSAALRQGIYEARLRRQTQQLGQLLVQLGIYKRLTA